MAVRSATEIIGRIKNIFGEQTPEGYLELLEDITDSVGYSGGVSQEEYDKVARERDNAVAAEKDMRDRYINRFYTDYNEPNNKGYIAGEVPQGLIEEEEKKLSYDDLFE